MGNAVAIWHTEHRYFQRLLDLLQREVDVFHSGERPNYDLMLDVITYLREYSDRFHHPREDVAFERLVRHHPKLALTIARLKQEHSVIARAGETLLKLLNEALGDAVVARAEIEVAAATYLVYYGNHIAKEEETVLGLAEKSLTPQDWEAVKAAVPAGSDPLFGESPAEHYRQLRHSLRI